MEISNIAKDLYECDDSEWCVHSITSEALFVILLNLLYKSNAAF